MQFDEQVERYLRRQMTVEEERAFKQSLADNPELKERARITALMIREMRNAVAEESSEDRKIIQAVKGMNEEQFRKAAGILPKAKVIRLWPRVMKYELPLALSVLLPSLACSNMMLHNIRQSAMILFI